MGWCSCTGTWTGNRTGSLGLLQDRRALRRIRELAGTPNDGAIGVPTRADDALSALDLLGERNIKEAICEDDD